MVVTNTFCAILLTGLRRESGIYYDMVGVRALLYYRDHRDLRELKPAKMNHTTVTNLLLQKFPHLKKNPLRKDILNIMNNKFVLMVCFYHKLNNDYPLLSPFNIY